MKQKLLALFALLLLPAVANAGVLDVSSPSVTKDEIGISQGIAFERDKNPGASNYWENSTELSYGVTSWWKATAQFVTERENGDALRYAATGMKNTIRFTPQTETMPVALGLRLDYKYAHLGGEADKVSARLLAQHKTGPWDLRLNAGVGKETGDNADSDLTGDVRAHARYWVNNTYAVSFDYLGDTGSLHDMRRFDDQDHRVGPALQLKLADGVEAELGYLAGISNNAPDHALKLNIGYDFTF